MGNYFSQRTEKVVLYFVRTKDSDMMMEFINKLLYDGGGESFFFLLYAKKHGTIYILKKQFIFEEF